MILNKNVIDVQADLVVFQFLKKNKNETMYKDKHFCFQLDEKLYKISIVEEETKILKMVLVLS